MILQGMTPNEIANTIALPEALGQHFYSRGYYGTVQHNAKAVYQHYMGWFDGNPANLHPLAVEDTAPKYLELMGGIDVVVDKAQGFYDKGEYQWVAELLNHAVFANPKHKGAKQLLAKAYDQMAYQAESGPWRSEYLTAAHELRHGITADIISAADAAGLLAHTPISTFLEAIAVTVDSQKAEAKELVIEFVFTDLEQSYVLSLRHSVLNFYQRPLAVNNQLQPTTTLTLTKAMFLRLISGTGNLRTILLSDDLSIDGSLLDLISFFSSLSAGKPDFPIVTP
jgi:alkyl sulfatase BDS1-like metallo-beta-lactamase superfamily hydrolase